MKRVAILLAFFCMLTVTAPAAYVPEDVVLESRDGRQLIVKTYMLPPDADPSSLVEELLEVEGHSCHHLETVEEEQTFEDSRIQTEVVTLETDVDDLAAILEQLDASMEHNKDGYSGALTLDHTTVQTGAAGYTIKYYTIIDTKQFTGLDQNNPSYVPTATIKGGSTLKPSDVSWTMTGTGLADDTLVPTSCTAVATYIAARSRGVATGYVTMANYTGEIKAEGVEAIKYTVTYPGNPVRFLAGLNPMWLPAGGGLLLLAGIGGIIYIMKRLRAVIYAIDARGIACKRLGKQKISTHTPKLDLMELREYPAGDASVELPSKLARKLAGGIITIQMYGGSHTHLVEVYGGQDGYWFAIKEDTEEKEESKS